MKIEFADNAIEWKEAAYKELDKKFFDDDHYFFVEAFEGDFPTILYYKGDVHLNSNLTFPQTKENYYYIIDGDLIVDGSLSIISWDYQKALKITGSLIADNLGITSEGSLYVEKNTTIKNGIFDDLSHAGRAYFKGDVTTKFLVKLSHGDIEFGKNSKFEGLKLTKTNLINEEMSFKELMSSLEKGEPILNI